MVQQIIVFLLGLYLLGEAIAAAALMQGGDRLCRVAKYLVTGVIGIWMIAEPDKADIWHIVMAAALALFVWPKMVKRLESAIEQFIDNWENWNA